MCNSKSIQYSTVKARANDIKDPQVALHQVEYLLASIVKRIRDKNRAEKHAAENRISRACNGGT